MLGDKRLELADHLRLAAELELSLEPVLPCRYARLFEPGGLGHHRVFELDVREGRPTPEPERFAQARRPLLRRFARGVSDDALEAVDIDHIPRNVEQVTRRASDEHLGTEHLPELRDEVLERADGCLRGFVAPELVHQPIRRDDLTGAQREEREQGALFLAAHVEDATVDVDLEWPE